MRQVVPALRASLLAVAGLRHGSRAAPVVAASLLIGILGSASAYRAADLLFWRNPPGLERPDELRRIWIEPADRGAARLSYAAVVSYPDFVDLKAASVNVADIAAYVPWPAIGQHTDQAPVALRVALVSPNFFGLLGIRAESGRLFSAQEAEAAAPLAVVSERALHLLQPGSPSNILGQSLRIAGIRSTVVGVVNRGFVGVDREPVDVWLPIAFSESLGLPSIGARNAGAFSLVGRLKVSDAAAAQLLSVMLKRLEATRGSTFDRGGRRVILGSIRDDRLHGPDATSRLVVFSLCAISLIILIVAVGNALILTLMGILRRQTLLATKIALGASGNHLALDLFLEAAAPCLIGAALGLSLGLSPSGLLEWIGMRTNGRTFGINTVIASLTTVGGAVAALSLGPLIFLRRMNLTSALRRSSAITGMAAPVRRACLGLLGGQLFVSTALSVITLSFAACLAHARAFDYGFDIDDLYAIEFLPNASATLQGTATVASLSEISALADRLRADGRIASVAVGDMIPFRRLSETTQLIHPGSSAPQVISFLSGQVDTAYLRTIGLRLQRGRWFAQADAATPGATVVVNQAFLREVAGGRDIVERCVPGTGGTGCQRIIGVVADASVRGLRAPGGPLVMSLVDRRVTSNPSLLIRLPPNTKAGTSLLRLALANAGVAPAGASVVSLLEVARQATETWRQGFLVFGVAALIGCLLSFVGAAAIVAYEVSSRGRELGIRLALGATSLRLTWELSRRPLVAALTSVGLGALIGLVVLTRLQYVVVGGTLPLATPAIGGAVVMLLIVILGVIGPTSPWISRSPIEALRLD